MKNIVAEILWTIRNRKGMEYGANCLTCQYSRMRVFSTGNVLWIGVGMLHLDWSQRRSIRRAFVKRHGDMARELIRLGLAAKNHGWTPPQQEV